MDDNYCTPKTKEAVDNAVNAAIKAYLESGGEVDFLAMKRQMARFMFQNPLATARLCTQIMLAKMEEK